MRTKKTMKTHTQTLTIRILLALLAGLAVPAFSAELTILSVSDEGSGHPQHPASYLVDGLNDTAFAAAGGSTEVRIVIELSEARRIQGIELDGMGTGSERYTVAYERNGAWVPFLSSLSQPFVWTDGSSLIDVSSDGVDALRVRLTIRGSDLSGLALSALRVMGEDLSAVSRVIRPVSLSASSTTSDYADEWDLFDRDVGTYWQVEKDPNEGADYWFVENYAEVRHSPRTRTTTSSLTGFVEASVPSDTFVEELKLYTTAEANGNYQVQVYTAAGWVTVSSMQAVPATPGWTVIPVNQAVTKVRVNVEILVADNTGAGFGELEMWGRTDEPVDRQLTYIHAPIGLTGTDTLKDALFTWSFGRNAFVEVAYAASAPVIPSIRINGHAHAPDSSRAVGEVRIARYRVEPGLLLPGVNFFSVDGTVVYARGAVVYAAGVNPADAGLPGALSDLPVTGWTDGSVLSPGTAPLDNIVMLGGMNHLSRVDVFASGSINGVSAWVNGAWQALTGVGTSDGISGFAGAGITTDRLLVDGGGIAEVRVWGSGVEPVALHLDTVYPFAHQPMPIENHGFQALYGEVNDADAVVTINGYTAERRGQLYWIELEDLNLDLQGEITATVVATTPDGRTTSQVRQWFVESSAYEMTLNGLGTIIYTNQTSYTVSGTYNPSVTRVYVDGVQATGSGSNYARTVNLEAGLNLIRLEQRSISTNRIVHTYLLAVWRQVDSVAVRVSSHPSVVYTNAATLTLTGEVAGVGSLGVTAGGLSAPVAGGYWTSQAIPLAEGENTITVTATDATGAQASVVITVHRDGVAPVVSIANPSAGAELGTGSVTVSGVVTDSSPATVMVNGYAAVVNGTSWTIDLAFADGNRSVSVVAGDAMGNEADPITRNFLVDTTPPEAFTPAIDPPSWTFAAEHTLSFGTTDATTSVVGYEGKIDSGTYVPVTSPWTLQLPTDGEHTISIRATDRLGNTRVGTANALVDRTAPAAGEEVRGVPGTGRILVRLSVEEAEFADVRIERSPVWPDGVRIVNRAEGTIPEPAFLPDRYTFEYADTEVSENTAYTYTITVADRAGNLSSPVVTEPVMTGSIIAGYDETSPDILVVEFDGASMAIPPASLGGAVQEVVISVADSQGLEDLAVAPLASPIYSFTAMVDTGNGLERSDYTEFAEPFTATLSYDPGMVGPFPEESLGVFYFDPTWSTWVQVDEAYIDTEANRILFSTNHFTDYTVKPTVVAEQTPQDLMNVPFGIGSSSTMHDSLSVSPQNGSTSTGMTEFVLPGRNGFDFALRRVYDSGTARRDRMSLPVYSVSEISTARTEITQGGRQWQLVQNTLVAGNPEDTTYLQALRGNVRNTAGDYGLSLGNGWRLVLPYVSIVDGEVTVSTLTGETFDIRDMVGEVTSQSGTERVLTFDGLRGSFARLRVYQSLHEITIAEKYGTQAKIRTEKAWLMTSAALFSADGSTTFFNDKGRVTRMVDPTGLQEVVFGYDAGTGVVATITQVLSDEVERVVTISHDGSYVSGISLPAESGERTVSYSRDGKQNLVSSTDVGGRNYAYTYESFLVATVMKTALSEEERKYWVPRGDIPDDVTHVVGINPDSLGTKTRAELFDLLVSVSARGLGVQTAVISIETLQSELPSDRTEATIDTVYTERLEVKRTTTDTVKRTTSYAYSWTMNPTSKQIYSTETSIDDTRTRSVLTYGTENASRFLFVSGNSITAPEETGSGTDSGYLRRNRTEPVPVLRTQTLTDLTGSSDILVQTETMSYRNVSLRLATREVRRASGTKTIEAYSYDIFGNVVHERRTEQVNGDTLVYERYALFIAQPHIVFDVRDEYPSWDLNDSALGIADVTDEAFGASGMTAQQETAVRAELAAVDHAQDRRNAAVLQVTLNEIPDVPDKAGSEQKIVMWTTYRTDDSNPGRDSFGQAGTVRLLEGGEWKATTYDYDQDEGELVQVTDALNQKVEYAWDYTSASVITLTTTVKGSTGVMDDISTVTGYSARTGTKRWDQGGRGYVTSYTSDALGRIRSVTAPDDDDDETWDPANTTSPAFRANNPKTIVGYDDTAMTVTVTKPRGQTEVYEFDRLGRIETIMRSIRERNSSGDLVSGGTVTEAETTFAYDAFGQLKTFTDAVENTTSFTYDGMGQMKQTTFADTTTVTSSMSWTNNTRTTVDHEGTTRVEVLRFDGKPKSRTVSGGGMSPVTETFYYDSQGRVVAITDGRGNTSRTEYTVRGEVYRTLSPVAAFIVANGNEVNARVLNINQYDDAGRLIERITRLQDTDGAIHDSRNVLYTLDPAGRTIETTVPYHEYTYDPATGELTQGEAKNAITRVAYDHDSNVISTTDPVESAKPAAERLSVTATYNARGQKTTETDQLGLVTAFSYDNQDNLIEMIDPRHGEYGSIDYRMTYRYDDLNRLIIAHPPKPLKGTQVPTVRFTYDETGKVLSRTDPTGAVTTYTYTNRNKLETETVTLPAGSVTYTTSHTYDSRGNTLSVTDPSTGVTSYTYDGLNRVKTATSPENDLQSFGYDASGNRLTITNGRGYTTATTYDALNRPTTITDARLAVRQLAYDLSGQPARTIDPLGMTTRYRYDERGLLLTQTNGRGKTWFTSYDEAGRVTSSIDPNGTVVTPTYDDRNQMTNRLLENTGLSATQQQTFTYDEAGILKTAQDGTISTAYNIMSLSGETAQYYSDPYGLTHTEAENGRTMNYTYDNFSRLTGIQAHSGEQVAYSYDPLGRLTGMGRFTTGFEYDAAGRLSGITAANGVETTYTYDLNNRLTGLSYEKDGTVLRSDTLGYDGNNNVVSKNNNSYFYNEIDELIQANLDARFAADLSKPQTPMKAERDVRGNTQLTYIETEVELGLDTNARSIGVDLGDDRDVYGFLITPQGPHRIIERNLKVYLSTVNVAGNFVQYTDYQTDIDPTTGVITIKFRTPQRARFAKVQCSWDERTPDNIAVDESTARNLSTVLVKAFYFVSSRLETYTYDDAGRRTTSSATYPQGGIDNESNTYTYYPNSELLKTDGDWGFAYDANGNQVNKAKDWTDATDPAGLPTIQPGTSDSAWRYTWDLMNRLTAVEKLNLDTQVYETVATYLYNYKNERIQKTDKNGLITKWQYDQAGQIRAIYYPDGMTETLVWMGSKLFARTFTDVNGTTTEYFATDHLGSTVLVTDEQGLVRSENDTTSFGTQTGGSGFDDLDVLYTGKDFDPDTELYYFNARWYDPDTGRFLSEDPAKDGVLWFAYVSNNPLTYTDPTGMLTVDANGNVVAEGGGSDPRHSRTGTPQSPFLAGLMKGSSFLVQTNMTGDQQGAMDTMWSVSSPEEGVGFVIMALGMGFAQGSAFGSGKSRLPSTKPMAFRPFRSRLNFSFETKVAQTKSGVTIRLTSNQVLRQDGSIGVDSNAKSPANELRGTFNAETGDLTIDWMSTESPRNGIGTEMVSRAIEQVGNAKVKSISGYLDADNIAIYEDLVNNLGLSSAEAIAQTPAGKIRIELGYDNLSFENGILTGTTEQ